MRARNRRKSSGGPALPMVIMACLVIIAMLALLYVWMDGRRQKLGAKIKQLELRLEEVNKIYANELSKWETLKTPQNIEKALARNKTVMVWPDESSIVRIRPANASDGTLAQLKGELARAGRGGRPGKAAGND